MSGWTLNVAVPSVAALPLFSAMKLTNADLAELQRHLRLLGAEGPRQPRHVAVKADDDLAVDHMVGGRRSTRCGVPRIARHLAEQAIERHRGEASDPTMQAGDGEQRDRDQAVALRSSLHGRVTSIAIHSGCGA